VQDITSEKDPSARLELAMAFLEAEREILRMLAAGEPLETMLTAIADKIDSLLEGSFCAIELLDRERSRFFWSVGPALPRSFFQEMAQLAVGPQSGTAAAAAFLNRNVIAADIATDPVWDSSRHTPLRFGMRASWSIPIRDRKSRVVVGALTVYHQTARRPEAEEIRAVEAAADLAGIAVDRKRQESDLWDSKHRFDVLTHHPPCQH
jgi:GAF domain-containing protein